MVNARGSFPGQPSAPQTEAPVPTLGFSEYRGDHGAWEWDLETLEINWNEGAYDVYGVAGADFKPTVESFPELIHPDDRSAYREAVDLAIGSRTSFLIQHRLLRPDGTVRTLLVRGSFIDGGGPKGRLVGTVQDMTGREGAEEMLWHFANRDPLTGLRNRRRFIDDLEHEIAVSRRTGQAGAVVMLDLDRFKEVNDTLGHKAGDNLLIRIAEILEEQLRETDRLARLGGDEFALLLPRCDARHAALAAQRVLEGISENTWVEIGGRRRTIEASAGLVEFTGGSETADELLVAADLAMYRGKRNGGRQVATYDHQMRAELAARMRTENELRDALEHGTLEAYYQPIVSIEDGTAVGCEALARWHHPERGILPPADFIAIAEEHGLIGGIGRTILQQACRQGQAWRHEGNLAYVSVNVSPVELKGEDVADSVRRTLEATGLPPQLLQLEITENFLIEDAAEIKPVLTELKNIGVRLAIDDFGGGTSSLSSLSALPFDVIKIDRSFISSLDSRGEDHAIVTAVVSLAEELELQVVAEGVETERQHGLLRELGCRYAQGYLYARPKPVADVRLEGYTAAIQPGVGDPSVIREFMRQIGIPARIES